MNLLFIDSCAYKPYSRTTLQTEALGGSEASMIRVCSALAKAGCDVSLFQHVADSRETEIIDGIRHVGMESAFPTPDVVCHFRTCRDMAMWEQLYPDARHIMWTQDVLTPDVAFESEGKEIVCLTDWHRFQYSETCEAMGVKPKSVSYIYNMVEVDGERQEKVKGRLGFFSSPHKGLEQVVEHFTRTQCNSTPDIHLVVANPGYLPDAARAATVPGVSLLGQLPHSRVMEELSKCEVLFYPQTVFPETQGIVLCEAAAMGVPVLSHAMGAAPEVLSAPGHQVVDCTNPENVRAALTKLLNEKPTVSLDPRFHVDAVVAAWKVLLGFN